MKKDEHEHIVTEMANRIDKLEMALRGVYQVRMWPDEVRHIIEEVFQIPKEGV